MPSFLNDENLPIFSSNLDVVDLASLDPYEYPDKGLTDQQPVHPPHAAQITESLDERSTLSTRDSDTCGNDPTTLNGNSNGTRPTSMGSITNGVPASDGETIRDLKSSDHVSNGDSAFTNEPAPIPPAKDHNAASVHKGTAARNSKASPEIADLTNSHSAPVLEAPASTLRLPESSSNVELQSQKDRTASLTPNSQAAELVPPKSSPHRFSSPPAYQPGNATLNSSPSGHLLPPGPPPVLKQRHTLETNKPAVGRTSKDGLDSAHATGRFSPTVAGSSNRRTSMNLGRRNTRTAAMDTPRDEVAPDEDALRWAEAYRQKRASKRRRKVEEDDDRVLVGTKVDETHANWVTAYNMLTGIRVSVSRTNAKLDRELTDADFQAKQKSTFDITGNELVPSAKYDFKFKDYAPWVFRRLRALFRLDPADYLMSLTGKYILSELGSPGKSGSFFYFSRDYRYIIKTIHHSEHKFLRKILKDYYTHVQNNPNTLLSQFYGLHRVKMPYGKKIHFVVMNNLFPPHRDIHTTFDLKGSTIGRDYMEEDLEQNPRATLKDLNWLRRQRNLELGIRKKQLFLEQVQKDVILLKRLQIMDYSLLVGIHDLSRGNEENLRDKTLQVFNPGGEKKSIDEEPQSALQRTPSKLETVRKARELREMIRQERPIPMGEAMDKMPDELGEGHSRPGFVFNQDDGGFQATHENNAPAEEIYYLGVIDCLTHYGMIKKIEHFWKGLSHDRTQISALPPEQYGDRFYNFIEGITMSHEEAEREAIRKEQEAAQARQSSEKTPGRSGKGKGLNSIPPMPTHQPPAPPSGDMSPSNEAKDTIAMASKQMNKTDKHGQDEAQLPDRTLTTATTGDARNGQHGPILPIVEEVGEGSRDENGGDKKMKAPTRAAPAVPSNQEHRVSRGSLDKELPPLPGMAQ